jgi:hypothetical protein
LKASFHLYQIHEKMASPAASKGNSGAASSQILAAVQKNDEMLQNMLSRLERQEEMLKDQTKLLQELDTKVDAARLAAPKAGRAKGAGGTSSKKDAVVAVPSINLWFRQIWKEDEEDTIAKYCKAESVERIRENAAKDPRTKSKAEGALKGALAASYYAKHFAKRDGPDFEREGYNALKKDHDALQKQSSEGAADGADGTNDADGDN